MPGVEIEQQPEKGVCAPTKQGFCCCCGGPLRNKRQQRYCSKECKSLYGINHFWGEARTECLKRSHNICTECKSPATEVHHLFPLNGAYRANSCLNHQDNLQALCHACHERKRKRIRVPVVDMKQRDEEKLKRWIEWVSLGANLFNSHYLCRLRLGH